MDSISRIIIPEGNKKHFIDQTEIKFIKADRYYVNIFCNSRKLLVRITMKNLEFLLPTNFLKVNKSVVVNMQFVLRIEEFKSACCIVLQDEIEQTITEKYKKELDNYLSNYK